MVTGRHSCSAPTLNASTVAITQPHVITAMTGHGASKAAGSGGGVGSVWGSIASNLTTPTRRWVVSTAVPAVRRTEIA